MNTPTCGYDDARCWLVVIASSGRLLLKATPRPDAMFSPPGPEFGDGHRHLARAGVARRCHHRRGRFVANADEADLRLAAERVEKRRQLAADDAEHGVDAFGEKDAHQCLGAGEAQRRAPRASAPAGRKWSDCGSSMQRREAAMVTANGARDDGRIGPLTGVFRHRIENAAMQPPAPLVIPYREVRHDQPDDCLHYESVAIRGTEMDWTIPAHRHDGLHQFQWLQQGAVKGSIDGRGFEASGPAMLMLAPGSVHALTYRPDSVGHQVTVPTSTLRQLLGGSDLVDAELGASFVISTPSDQSAIAARFSDVAREFQSSELGRVHALLALAMLIATSFIRRARYSIRTRQALRHARRARATLSEADRGALHRASLAGVLR